MNPFVELGLSMDADEAQIRRAYAQRLRTTRPDDDAAGFQQLNEAYQRCLARAREHAALTTRVAAKVDPDHRVEGDPYDSHARPHDANGHPATATADLEQAASEPRVRASEFAEPPRIVAPLPPGPRAMPAADPSADPAPIPIPLPPDPSSRPGAAAQTDAAPPAATIEPEPGFDAGHFLSELSHIARTRCIGELQGWLRENPALYSVARKQQLAPLLVAYLGEHPSLYLKQLDAVLHFFDLDTIHERYSALQGRIADLRVRAKAAGLDFRELEFDPAPRPGKRQAGFELTPQMVLYLLVGLAVVARVLKAISESGQS